MNEKNLDDFFKKEIDEKNVKRVREKRKKPILEKGPKSTSFREFFRNRFSFDVNVDLTNPTNVLYRKNYVIKNIIFLANLIFSLFAFIGISKSNYILTLVFCLLMMTLSQTIAQMRKRKKDDFSHQTVIMYLQCLYVFILAVILYIKVWAGFRLVSPTMTNSEFSVTQAAYLLIYFSLVITSLYQNPKLVRTMFIWALVVMTVLHCSILHPELYQNASNLNELIHYAFVENNEIVIDIFLRTIVLLAFFAALYSAVSITYYMNEERKNEFNKRKGVETNFIDVVESVFEAVKVYNLSSDDLEQKMSAKRVAASAKELAIAMAYDQETIQKIYEFSEVHSEKIKMLVLDEKKETEGEDMNQIMEKTKLATTIIKRLQLCKKGEDIVMSVFEHQVTDDFRYNMTHTQNDRISQIILLCEIYDILRNDRSYKKGLNHLRSLELINNDFDIFFDKDIVNRFSKYNHEIETAYEKAI